MFNQLKGLRTNENLLLAIDALFSSKSIFFSTFLMAFMVRTSVDDSPVEYIVIRLLGFIGVAILAIGLLRFIKKHTLAAWRLGALFSIIRITVIITLHTHTDIFPYVLALVYAIESTLFWRPGMFYMISEVRNDRRLRFHSFRQIFTNSIRIIMPLFLGLTISESGYISAAYFILAISIVQFLLSILFRPSRDLNFPFHHVDVTFRKIVGSQPLRRVLYLQFFRGIIVSGSAFMIIPPLMVYKYTNSDFELGLFASIGAVISIVLILIFQRVSRSRDFARAFLWLVGPLAIVFSAALYVYPSTITAIALYVYFVAVIEGFFDMFVMSRVQRSLKKQLGSNSFVLEIESVSEVFVCIGRAVSLTALLFVVIASGVTYLPLFATINALLIIPVVILSRSKKKPPMEIEGPIP